MTTEEKLRFLEERMEDEKEFSIGSEFDIYRFRNFKLMYVENKKNEDSQINYSSLFLNYILTSSLKLKPQRKFTEDEKVILRNLPDDFQWIARDEHRNGLYVYRFKPSKSEHHWLLSTDGISIFVFNHLFQSIQWSDDEPCEFRKYL